MTLKGKAAIVGAYEWPHRSAPGVHPFALHAECIRHALDDAGLTLRDVDGFCAAAGDIAEGGGFLDIVEVAEYLGMRPTYFNSTEVGGCSYVIHAGHAAAAIEAGLAEVVVISYAACPRSYPSDALATPSPDSIPVGPLQFEVPYALPLVGHYALMAARHMAEFGTTPEQLAQVAVTCRNHAAANEQARYREKITIDDVIGSPLVASPLHRLDCCAITDGGGAIVMTGEKIAKQCRRPPVWLLGFGSAMSHLNISQMDALTVSPASLSGPLAFEMAGVTHDNIDVAQLYDAFTITPLLAIEDLGFCEKGDGGPFVASGALEVDGTLPINTDGGGLSSNHPGKRGILAMIEAVRQLRGEGPGVQVADPEVALVHALGGYYSTSATAILGR